MIENHYQAADEIARLFIDVWTDAIAWPNLAFEKPALSDTWAKWRLAYNDGGQETLPGVAGRARYEKSGLVVIEIFTPLGSGTKVSYEAAKLAIDAYEGKKTPSDVWFRNVKIIDEREGSGGNQAWWQTTVTAEFQYSNTN